MANARSMATRVCGVLGLVLVLTCSLFAVSAPAHGEDSMRTWVQINFDNSSEKKVDSIDESTFLYTLIIYFNRLAKFFIKRF